MPTASAADNSSAAANSMGVLENTSVKAGVNYTAGTLGSGGNTSPGLMFDATGSSIFNDEYDYLTLNAPYDGFAVKVDGTNFHNNNATYVADAFSASGSLVDGIDTLTWSGSATIASSTWSIQHVYTLEGDQDYVVVQTTITAGSNASTVSFGRFIDPDARAAAGDDRFTDNVLGYSGVPATNVVVPATNVVLSEALVSRYTLGLYSTDSNVTAGVTSPWSSQADGYSGTPTDYGGNLYGQGDDAIGMSWSWSSVSIGDTLTASYAYIFGPSAFTRDIDASGDTISNLVEMSGSLLNSVFDGGELIIDQDLATTDVASFAIKSGTGNAQLNVASGDDHSVGSKFTDNSGDTGVLEKVGAGTLVLTNTANDYTGGTTVSAGTLEIASDSVLGATSGGVTLNGGTLATTANMSSARAVSLGASNGTVDTAAATTLTLSGVMSGSGSLTKAGAGVLTVTGTNTYTGGTTVSAGTLDLDGSLTSDVAVASTGRIEGVGSTSGDLTSSGTVAPGNAPGTLTVAGDVVFTGTNNFITELDGLTYSAAGGAGTYDRLAVTGTTATFTAAGAIAPILRGISAPANNTLDPVIGDAFRVVTTANASGVSGAFSTVTDPTSGMPANTRFDVLYGGNYVDLVLTPDDLSTFAAAYGIQNMVNAADAFDGIRPAQGTNGATDKDKFFNGLYGLTAQETAVALLQASGEVHAFALSDARDAWSDGLGTVRSSSQGVGDYYWVDMSGYNLAVDEDTIASAYDSKTRKFWIGSDVYQDRSTTYGFALGVSESELSMANSGSADTTTYSLAAYMRGAQGAFEYDGLVSLNRSNIDTNRSVSLSTGSLSNTSSSDVRGLAMSAQLGYRYDVAPSLVSGLAWIKGDLDNTRTDTFTEDGSTVTALTVNGYEVKSAKVSVGYTLSGKIPNSGVEAGLWSFGVGAAKDVSRGMPDVSRTMSLHGASWSVSVPKAGDVTKFVSGGIAIPLGNDAVAELSLSAAKRDGALSKSAAFGFSAKW